MTKVKKLFAFFANEKFYKFYSFLFSFLLMLTIFLVNKMNGKDYLILRSDYLEGVGFFKHTCYSILNHQSIFFNFSSGLGINNIMFLSGFFSPLNILYLVFYNSNIDIVTMWIILIKIGLSSFSFNIFSNKVLKNNNFTSIIISVFYSLNAFSIEYGTIHVSWINALIVLPLLIWAIVECIQKNKRVFLIILYSYIFISNYYLAYMIGFFSLIFVVLYLFLIYKNINIKIKDIFSKFLNWFLAAVIAVMISSFIWIPTLFFIASNRVPDSTELKALNYSIFQLLNSMFWGMSYGIEGTYSYLYCGIPCIILCPLFFINKKIELKEKKLWGFLIIMLIFCMSSKRLNSFWHVFDQPDDFWFRYSFLLCFCFCSISCKQLSSFSYDIKNKIYYVIGVLLLFYQFILHTISIWNLEDGFLNSNYGFVINTILIVVWSFIFVMIFTKNKIRILMFFISLLVLSIEIVTSSKRQISNLVGGVEYNQWTNESRAIVDEINNNDNDLYRMVITQNNIAYNTDTYLGYNGICDFGNQEKYSVRKFLSNVGFASSPRITLENGFNPVSEMLLGIKYEINPPEMMIRNENSVSENTELNNYDLNKQNDFKEVEDNTPKYVINENALKIGYLVNGDVILYDYSGRNVFVNMNELLSCLSGLEDNCFVKIPLDDVIFDSSNIELSEMDDGKFVLSKNGTEGKLKISVSRKGYEGAFIQFEEEEPSFYGMDYYINDSLNSSNETANRLSLSSSIRMIPDEENDCFYLEISAIDNFSPDVFACDNINIYYFDKEAFLKQYENLSANQFMIDNYSNGFINGSIHVDDNRRLMMTSIPYDPGWKVYINGIETEAIRVIDGAFMAIYLPGSGDYNVTFKFECPGLKIGCIVSLCGIIALLSVVFEKKLKKK